jgi:phage FluMu gp28-like protein
MQINYQRPFLTTYQEAILDAPERYTITAAATKCGKTASHIIWIFEQALQLKDNQSVWWIAPVYQQAEIAFRRMKSQVSEKNFFISNESKLTLILPNGARIEFKSGEKPDNLYGDDVYAAVVDEASRMREESWYALRSTLTATKGKCKMIGNVKGKKNWFYKLGERARLGEDDYKFFKITAYDAAKEGILDIEEIEQAKRDLPEFVFKELYLAEPGDDNSNPFGLDNIRKCYAPLSSAIPIAFGIDLAKYTDWTVITGLDNTNRVCYTERFQGDWMQTKQKIINAVGRIPAHIDATGVGDPIVEDLQRILPNIKGFKYTSQSKQQLMEGLVMEIQQHSIFFPEEPYGFELENFEYEYTRTGVKYSAPSGMHDDAVNSIALANDCKKHNRKGIFAFS